MVWVANRENPLNDSLGVLKVTSQGKLVVLNAANRTLWSSTTSRLAQLPLCFTSQNQRAQNDNFHQIENKTMLEFNNTKPTNTANYNRGIRK